MARYEWLECGCGCWSGDVLTDEVREDYRAAYDAADDGDGAPSMLDTVEERFLPREEV